MKIAVISDIHGNLEALKAVLADIEQKGADQIFCLGDIVGYGPYPSECLNLLSEIGVGIIGGNHEEMACNFEEWKHKLINIPALKGIGHTVKCLSQNQMEFLKKLPDSLSLFDMDITFAHGGFSEPQRWAFIGGWQDAKNQLEFLLTKTGVCGHTHRPFVFISGYDEFFRKQVRDLDFDQDEKFIFNVGSVGQPRDGDPRACYGLINYSDERVSLSIIRVDYDIEKTSRAIKELGLPEISAERLFEGR